MKLLKKGVAFKLHPFFVEYAYGSLILVHILFFYNAACCIVEKNCLSLQIYKDILHKSFIVKQRKYHLRIVSLLLVGFWGFVTLSSSEELQRHDILLFDDLSENKEASEIFDLDQNDLKDHSGSSFFGTAAFHSFDLRQLRLSNSPTILATHKKGTSCGLHILYRCLKVHC